MDIFSLFNRPCQKLLTTVTRIGQRSGAWHTGRVQQRTRLKWPPTTVRRPKTMLQLFLTLFQLYLLAIMFFMALGTASADFIDKVECEKDKMVVYINEGKVQEDYPAIGVDKYSVYVHQFKDSCNDQGVVSQSNSLKSKRFVVPLNAGCGINSQADNTMGIHKEWLVYQATVRLEAIKPRSPDGRILEQRVKCVYSTSHQATASSNRLLVKGGGDNMVSSRQSPVLGAGTVEGSAPPIENFIELFFASPDPKFSTLQEATIGDAVRIVLRMSHNVAYSAMKPEFCIISNKPYANRNDPDFRELIVVNAGCSVQSTPPLIPKMVYRASLAAGEPEMYYSKFTMFKMGDYNELHAMCNVKLCISSSEKACDTTQPRGCFESVRRRRKKRSPDRWSVQNSTLPRTTTNDKNFRQQQQTSFAIPALLSSSRLGRLYQQQQQQQEQALTTPAPSSGINKPFNPDLLTVSGRLHVHQQAASASAALGGSQLCFHSVTFSIMAAVLAWLFVLSFSCVIMLACLLRTRKRTLAKTTTAYSSSSCASSSGPTSSSVSCPPHSSSLSNLTPAPPPPAPAPFTGNVQNNNNKELNGNSSHYQTYETQPTHTANNNNHCGLMYPQYHHHHGYCNGGGGRCGGGGGGDDSTTMLKLRHFPHSTLLRRQSIAATGNFVSPLATTITAHNRLNNQQNHHHHHQVRRHHTLKPTTPPHRASSSSSATCVSSASSVLPASPSPVLSANNCNGGGGGGHEGSELCYDVPG